MDQKPPARVIAMPNGQYKVFVSWSALAWCVVGAYTTPPASIGPAFEAISIRAVNDDGSESGEVIDTLDRITVGGIECATHDELQRGDVA